MQYLKYQLSVRSFGVGGTEDCSLHDRLFQTGWHLEVKVKKIIPDLMGPKHFSD